MAKRESNFQQKKKRNADNLRPHYKQFINLMEKTRKSNYENNIPVKEGKIYDPQLQLTALLDKVMLRNQ